MRQFIKTAGGFIPLVIFHLLVFKIAIIFQNYVELAVIFWTNI